MSSSLLITGNTYQQVKEMMDVAKIKFVGKTLFYRIQKFLLFPAIHKIYLTHRELIFQTYLEENKNIDLVGDGLSRILRKIWLLPTQS